MTISNLIIIHKQKQQNLELRLIGLEDEKQRQYYLGQIIAYDVAISGLETIRKTLSQIL